MPDEVITKTIPELSAGAIIQGSLFENAQPNVQASTGYNSVKVTADDVSNYVATTKTYSQLQTTSKTIVSAINEAAQSGGGGASVIQKTLAEYQALPQSSKMNGSIYKITDKALIYCLDEEYHAYKELTTIQYQALTSDEKNNGTIYIITDEETTADDIEYSSGVSVADKIDEANGQIIPYSTWSGMTPQEQEDAGKVFVPDYPTLTPNATEIPMSSSDNTSVADMLDITDITSTYCTTTTGVTLEANDSSVYKQGKHIWGNLQFVIPSSTSQQVIATITNGFQPSKTIIGYAGYSGSKWSVDTIGSLYVGANRNIACTVSVSGKTYVNIVIDYLTN